MTTAVETTYPEGWCLALHGNHDEHQCHKKPGHADVPWGEYDSVFRHECYCGVWW